LPFTSATRVSEDASWLQNHIDQIVKTMAEAARVMH